MIPNIHRRRFLKVSSLASLYALLWSFSLSGRAGAEETASTQPKTAATKTEILVIGAGAAGIGAARALQDDGFDVIVLEARSRIGGRVWSDRSWSGAALDMGASWIHGINGNPLTELVKKFALKTLPTDYDSLLTFNPQGHPLTDAARDKLDARLEEVLAEAAAWGEELDEDVSLQAGIDHVLAGRDLSRQERLELDYAVNTTIEHEFAADAAEFSLWYGDEGTTFGGGDVIFPGGYDQIFKRLAEGLDIRLNQPVQKVEYGSAGVKITNNNGIFEADRTVVTLPLGVLKTGTISFCSSPARLKNSSHPPVGHGPAQQNLSAFSRSLLGRRA
ncbi:MAG: FAD-dependent oxidoreductase [Anaerolineales bacterium]|nr:FAD-dependent oxidoreductase [Anaerolineales bacterium]